MSSYINDFYTSININQRIQYCHANQNTKEWERWTPIPIFPIEATNSLTCFAINHCNFNKLQQTLLFYFLFSESFTWLFNCYLWVWYTSLGINYYFWQRSALAIDKSLVEFKQSSYLVWFKFSKLVIVYIFADAL